jgi:hypothetical protein
VISEIMYNPAGPANGDAEYFELLNVTDAPVTLYDSVKGKAWRISDGIDFEFPAASPLTEVAVLRYASSDHTIAVSSANAPALFGYQPRSR